MVDISQGQPNIVEQFVQNIAETLCSAVTAPGTIIGGLIEGDPEQVVDGLFDAAAGVAMIQNPALAARGMLAQETTDAILGQPFAPELNGNSCIAGMFNAHAPLTAIPSLAVDPAPAGTVVTPRVLNAGDPGSFEMGEDLPAHTSSEPVAQRRPSAGTIAVGGLY